MPPYGHPACVVCGCATIGMRAPIQGLIRQTDNLLKAYGWISPAVIQRRLRVTPKMAAYLNAEVNDGRIPPHWLAP
jgi:hypothetical protein